MKKVILMFLVLLAVSGVKAQTSDNAWAAGIIGGVQQFAGEQGSALYQTGQAAYGFGGLTLARYIDDRCDFILTGTAGDIGFSNDKGTLRAFALHANIGVRVKILLNEKAKLVPYFTPGLGVTSLSSYSYGTETLTTWVSPSFALGLKYNLTPLIALTLEEKGIVFQNNKPANPVVTTHNAFELQHTLGILFTLGDPKVAAEPTTKVTPDLPVVSEKTKTALSNAMKGVQFETGSDVIKGESFPILDEVAGELKDNQNLKLAINGYTDNTGDADKNLTLSQKRADAVKAYLVKKGTDAARLKATGYGIANPIGDNATPEGRAKNRRVEFLVL